MNNPEKCEQTCTVLLNADPNNESAAVMMADLAFRKVILVCCFKFYCNCHSGVVREGGKGDIMHRALLTTECQMVRKTIYSYQSSNVFD